MITIGRWAILAVLGAAMMGCGGNDSKTLPDRTGVIFKMFAGVYSINTKSLVGIEVSESGLFHENGVPTIESFESPTVVKYLNYPVVQATSEQEAQRTAATIQLQPIFRYLNATLAEIGFSLNQDIYKYGYNVTIRQQGSDQVLWNYQEMMDWCIALPAEKPLLEFSAATTEYTEPATLGPAESFPSVYDVQIQDMRVASCPLLAVSWAWIGRSKESIQSVVDAKYTEYVDLLNTQGCLSADQTAVLDTAECTALKVDNKPNASSLEKDVLLTAGLIAELAQNEASFEMVVDISINEFVDAAPYVLDFKVETADAETLEAEVAEAG
ncbi:MAG: hypothetical protein CSA49_02100 [Gammaproteobacteria bacterium]|nr:MAG: hypothetical protein CSA49_02100 [Gammaproteobacteria bacterium]